MIPPALTPNNNFTTISDNNQIPQTNLSSLHQFSSIPHSPSPTYLSTQTWPSTEQHPLLWPLQQPPLAPYHFSSQNQSSPTHQPTQSFLQPPQASPSHFSSLHQSRPEYQSMQALLSGPAVPSPTWLSSPDKHQQSSICHIQLILSPTLQLVLPHLSTLPCFYLRVLVGSRVLEGWVASYPGHCQPHYCLLHWIIFSLPLEHSPHSTLEPNPANQAYSVSPVKLNFTTQTSTIPTFTINSLTAGSTNSSLQVSPVDMT